MQTRFSSMLLLHMLEKVETFRTPRSVYHIVTGKRSAQTLQDARWFHLDHWFHIYPHWREAAFYTEIDAALKTGWLALEEEGMYSVTPAGRAQLQMYQKDQPFPAAVNGWRFAAGSRAFWPRLHLAVHTLSHLAAKETSFRPAEGSAQVQQYIKAWLKGQRSTYQELAANLYSELERMLQELPASSAASAAGRLSGLGMSGRTLGQLAVSLNLEEERVKIEWLNALHFILQTLTKDPGDYPLLASLAADILAQPRLTYSASQTYRLLQKGMNLTEISAHRGLKNGTVEDHFVEIAGEADDFPLYEYVSPQIVEHVRQTVNDLETKKLRAVKEAIEASGQVVSYFQLRLALSTGEEMKR
ncbi:uncharacterized protein YpbB [Salsuginibacillus halophilus]|uniref:Uncharacterized protein YpbB n=1 Tax=Salsuginibacillus halophilus TaxID=517424 RepID=A0A2P8HWA8_9BACI|nr:helix-turn-helix domain-containing protein [Salsuginibacillus halophilus]PSL50458.1 uncharacterized protein YpbB [Salsuginibacillus halophilus]